MRQNRQHTPGRNPANDTDPRHAGGGEVIDLATRHVLPAVTQRRRSDGFGLAAGVALVALLGGLTLWGMNSAREMKEQEGRSVPATASQRMAAPGNLLQDTVLPGAAPRPALPRQAPFAAPPQGQVASAPAQNPHATPTVLFDASALPAPMAGPLTLPGAPQANGNSNDDFASRLGGVGGSAATATASIDPKTTVSQGTLIPAVLETAIDTDVPGYVRAVVSADVRSFDGSRVLVPRSSRLVGQYKSGMQAGQKRVYVIWTRLIRPDGVSVNIGSPAIGFGGETGLEGKVSTHFFERFGSAMLLSVVGGLSALTGNASVIIGGGGQSAAATAVGQTGQIGPTIRVRQGEPIRIFTARDLDFSKVASE
jgi:type IV secretion system protein VirB10